MSAADTPQKPEGVYTSVEQMIRLRHLAGEVCLETNKKSVALMDGDSRTSYRGRGMEFSEVRRYQAGDDVRNIDWRVTARTQKPYTKLFQEERERPVYLLVDQRANMFFGSQREFKSVYAANLAAIIAWASLQNNDRIGALVFSEKGQSDTRARRGKHAALSIIHKLVEFNHQLTSPVADDSRNSMEDMLNDMRRIAKPGSSVFIISDFCDFYSACQEPLSVLARHCDVTAIHTYDPLEYHLPADQALSISDGQKKLTIAGQSQRFAQQFSESFEQHRFAVRKACNQARVLFASAPIDIPLETFVQDFFRQRRQQHKRGAR